MLGKSRDLTLRSKMRSDLSLFLMNILIDDEYSSHEYQLNTHYFIYKEETVAFILSDFCVFFV